MFRQDHEFVTTQAGKGILVANRGLEPSPHGLEQLVAQAMAQAVVDALEVVQVDEEQPQEQALAPGDAQGMLQAQAQQGAVGQVGKGVVVGQVFELGLVVLDRADVGEDADALAEVAGGVTHGAEAEPDGIGRAIRTAVEDLAAPAVRRGHGLPGALKPGRLRVLGRQSRQALIQDLPCRVAGDG